MLPELDTYNWAEVFGEGDGGNCSPITPNRAPHDNKTSTATFRRADVKKILGLAEGERDEADWVVYGKLKDGRYFVARGGCDYTGWDCRAGNSGDVASSRADIERFGLTTEERNRFGIKLKE
jgi:hypothetical protein